MKTQNKKTNFKFAIVISTFFIGLLSAGTAQAYNEAVLIKVAKNYGIPQKQIDKVTGYINKYSSSLPNKKYVTFVDFRQGSNKKRGYLINTDTGSVQTFLVAHGSGSGSGKFATSFSNVYNSHKSSLGLYYVKHSYEGQFGYSARMTGLESSNNNAEGRAIVIHPYFSVNGTWVTLTGKVGTTKGCFGLDKKVSADIINKTKGGSLWLAFN